MLTVEEIRANHFQIKIRGWNGDYMEYTHTEKDDCCLYESIEGMSFRCGDENLMLWTGDKDADGKDIYCKDILRLSDPCLRDANSVFVALITRRNEDHPRCFDLLDISGNSYLYQGGFSGSDFKVIGNIYENPELWPVKS